MDAGNVAQNGKVADLRIPVLVDEGEGFFKKRQAAAGQGLVVLLDAPQVVERRRIVDDLKVVGVFSKGSVGLLQGVQGADVLEILEQRHELRPVAAAVLVAQKGVHRHLKEIGHLHEQGDLRHGAAGFPFIDRPHRHAQGFGQLLLGEVLFPAVIADVLRKFQFHGFSSLFAIVACLKAQGNAQDAQL